MLYLLYGDSFKVNNEINKVIKDNNIDDINISKYDMDATNYKDIIDDANSVSLFDEQKLIIDRYFNDLTQGEVANILGINQVSVSRKEKKVLEKLKVRLR